MQAISTHSLIEELEGLVTPHISRLVRQTPNYVNFEAKSHADAMKCVELLQPHHAELIHVVGTWYVICIFST